MHTKIIWQCQKCGFEIDHDIELIKKHGEPVCICGEYMSLDVELE
jgi:hypothetical protein